MSALLVDRARYVLPDGRRFIILNFDYKALRYRIAWDGGKHEDVSRSKLLGAVLVETFDRGVR